MSRSIEDVKPRSYVAPVIDAVKQKEIDMLIKMSDAVSSLINKNIFLIDYIRQEFLYVSPHRQFLCGYELAEVKAMGYAFFNKVLPPEDMKIFLDKYQLIHRIAVDASPEDRDFRGSHDLYFRHKNGKLMLVNAKYAPLHFTDEGFPWIGMLIVSSSPRKKAGYSIFIQKARNGCFHYNPEKKKFEPHDPKALSPQEERVIRLSAQGYTETDIAGKLNISRRTVQNHRKNVAQKLGVNSLTNAVATFYSDISI